MSIKSNQSSCCFPCPSLPLQLLLSPHRLLSSPVSNEWSRSVLSLCQIILPTRHPSTLQPKPRKHPGTQLLLLRSTASSERLQRRARLLLRFELYERDAKGWRGRIGIGGVELWWSRWRKRGKGRAWGSEKEEGRGERKVSTRERRDATAPSLHGSQESRTVKDWSRSSP